MFPSNRLRAHSRLGRPRKKKKNLLFPTDPPSEKQTRGALRSAVDRALASSKPPPAVVVDGCNAVKGFRYELWCLGRPFGARFCCVFCPEPGCGSAASSPSSSGGAGHALGRWPRSLFDDLAARVEPPDPRNRWEQPLFIADARRPRSSENGVAVADAPVRPAPASLPAGGRGAAIEETIGWPLDSVAAAVVAAVAAPGRAMKKAESDTSAAAVVAATAEETSTSASALAAAPQDTLPLATTSIALRPAKCTLAARVAGADALGDLDAAAQTVLLAVAAALSPSASKNGAVAPTRAAAFAAIEIPISASSDAAEEQEAEGAPSEEPLTLSLRRAPTLAELRRHKRDFLRAATAPMAGPLPDGARAGASAFCEYLKRRVV